MPSITERSPVPKLSICISTFNRAAYIGATLDCILDQVTADCEVVVLDGASSDGTEQLVSEYARRHHCVRYFRQDVNNGVDRDYDRVVELARGEYCWLMTDDDLLKQGAVEAVLHALTQDLSLVVVNIEFVDLNISRILQPRWLQFDSDRLYEADEMDRLFADVGDFLKYIGGTVIKRSIWLARKREPYYGSWFVHVGVIFQKMLPGRAQVIARPLISHRTGNANTFSSKVAEILLLRWPSLLESLAVSEAARKKVKSSEFWRYPSALLRLRAEGSYRWGDYCRWIRPKLLPVWLKWVSALVAVLPGTLLNSVFIIYYSTITWRSHGIWQSEYRVYMLKASPFFLGNWRAPKDGAG